MRLPSLPSIRICDRGTSPAEPSGRAGAAGVRRLALRLGLALSAVAGVLGLCGALWRPAGKVEVVRYRSPLTGKLRRMHVYTPPGYEQGREAYPVLYLLHGGYDTDDAWTRVGRAHLILDDLIARREARPMLVVMPALLPVEGFGPGTRPEHKEADYNPRDPFRREMVEGIIPWVEQHYRVLPGRENRALAGLSLGAVETVSVGLPRLDQFSHFGAFSGGLGRDGQLDLERRHRGVFKDEELTRGVRLFFVAYGVDDQAKVNARGLLDSLRRSGIQPTLRVTSGGHNWINWRQNLQEFVPRLFRS